MPEPWRPHPPRRTFNRNAIIALVAFAVIAILATAWSTSNSEPRYFGKTCDALTLEEQFRAADVVVTGQVFIVIPSQLGADVVIDPIRIFKGGLVEPTVRIVANRVESDAMGSSMNQSDELQFASTQPPYLLFLHARSDGRYHTQACLGSRLLGEGLSHDEEAILGDGEVFEK